MKTDFLICPRTKQPIKINWEDKKATTYDGIISYTIVDGIIDFVVDNQSVSKSYDSVSSYYDVLLSNNTTFARIYNKIVWGIKDIDYVNKVLSFIPSTDNKIILDIPVGSGLFTSDFYKKMRNSTIIACDYSMGMIKKAKERYEINGLSNVLYLRCDIAQMPVETNKIDVLLTMNGFHAFSNKDKALSEIVRVIKPQGTIAGCFYIKKQRILTDLVINTLYKWQGSFSAPFYTKDEIRNNWGKYFDFQEFHNLKSIIYFNGIKKLKEKKGII
jgi:ubiquinone/menaquinone biosynthesis C-methylase UbiE